MNYRTLIIGCSLALMSVMAGADNTFNSIGGFSLGQECTGPKFTNKESNVRNPNDVLDKIHVQRNMHESKVAGGNDLNVSCSIIDNTIYQITLSSENPDAISNIKDSLREKMGRKPDDEDTTSSEPQSLLGITMDGHNVESEYWHLSNGRKATAYTMITQPYGSNSLSDLKWRGGIELTIVDRDDAEWEYLKTLGRTSSKQEEAADEKARKDRIKGLLE